MSENKKNRGKAVGCPLEDNYYFPNIKKQNIDACDLSNIIKTTSKISEENIRKIQSLTEMCVKLFLNSKRPLSLTKLSKKMSIHRKTFSRYTKKYLMYKYGKQKGTNLYKAMWSRKVSDKDFKRIREIVNTSLYMYNKGYNPPSLRKLSKEFLFTFTTLAKYLKKDLIEKFGDDKAEELYKEIWSNQKKERISPEQIIKIHERVESALNLVSKEKDYTTLQNIGKDLGLSGNTIKKYAKDYLIQKFGILKGNEIYENAWGKYLNSETIKKINELTYFALRYYKRGIKPPSIFSLSSLLEINEYTFSDYAKKFLTKELQSEKKGLEVYKAIWLSKYDYEDLQRLAHIRGIQELGIAGKLVTTSSKFNKLIESQYPSDMKLLWWCGKKNHEYWKATPTNIQQGSWCPYCSQGKSEAVVRWYFEKIFKRKFKKTMLRDIIHGYNGKLHSDGYSIIKLDNKLIKLAFEFNGYQHYEFPNYFHHTMEEFLEQQNRDCLKRKLCLENNIILIIFPYHINPRMKSPKKIQKYIVEQFEIKTNEKLSNIRYYDHRKIPFNYVDISKL